MNDENVEVVKRNTIILNYEYSASFSPRAKPRYTWFPSYRVIVDGMLGPVHNRRLEYLHEREFQNAKCRLWRYGIKKTLDQLREGGRETKGMSAVIFTADESALSTFDPDRLKLDSYGLRTVVMAEVGNPYDIVNLFGHESGANWGGIVEDQLARVYAAVYGADIVLEED